MKQLTEQFEETQDTQKFCIKYVNKDTELVQYLKAPAGMDINAKLMKAWIESKGGTFKSLRKVSEKTASGIYFWYVISDKIYDEAREAAAK